MSQNMRFVCYFGAKIFICAIFHAYSMSECCNGEDETFTGDGEANREALIEDWDFSFSPWAIHFES